MTAAVAREQRFTASNPCPICDGHAMLPQGRGVRCYGFLSDDRRYAHCTRNEFAGDLGLDSAQTYAHILEGPCRCGVEHGPASERRTASQRSPVVFREQSHVIRDQGGTPVAIHGRKYFDDGRKDVWWSRPNGAPGLNGTAAVDLPLYGVHELGSPEVAAVGEGEPARDALASLGIAAVGTVCGAKSTPSEAALQPLLGVPRIVLWPDNDGDGANHMGNVARRLLSMGHSDVRMLDWPDAPPKGDAADFVARGGTREGIERLIAAARSVSAAESAVPRESEPVTPIPDPWPELDPAALHGLAGEIVEAVVPTTEADPVAILVTFLVAFGNACGRGPHVMIGDDRHGTNLFAALVGDTGDGRKGSSDAPIHRLMMLADPTWAVERKQGGLSTGEGLIHAIRDERRETNKKGEEYVADAGVSDKRLLCIEEEMSFMLKTATRQGNTVSEIERRAWDSRPTLRVMTKTSPSMATNPHVSILAHITRAELARNVSETDMANGFLNRYAWFAVRRSKFLPEPVGMPEAQANALARRIVRAKEAAVVAGELRHDDEAREVWAHVYPMLAKGRQGLAGALTARSAPIVRRLALVYALLDERKVITRDHLEAALALWDYADASVRMVFGDLTGDAVADRILAVLRRGGQQSQTEIYELFGRNVPAHRIGQALEALVTGGLAACERVEPEGGRGRPKTLWRALPQRAGGGSE